MRGRFRNGAIWSLLAAAFGTAIVVTGTRAAHPAAMDSKHTTNRDDISGMATRFNDLQATLHIVNLDQNELEKIGKDFAHTYAIRTLTLLYKQPDKLRLDGRSPILGEAVLILNGTERFYAVPRLKLQNHEDLKDMPSKRQSLLEYSGLISPEMLTFMQAHFVQEEPLNGQEALVYTLSYRNATGVSHYRVWIDPKSHVTLKREWYDSANHLKATFLYQDPREVSPGVWLPSRVEVKNGNGASAAVTDLENVQIDQGLSDALFAIK